MGCSWQPSPALITEASVHPATRWAVPAIGWRTTSASAPYEATTSTVSRRLSPLLRDEPPAEKAMVSADRRRAAVSKDMRVRVEFSKKTVATVRPRKAGTFGMGRRPTSANVSVNSSNSSRSDRDIPSIPNRCPAVGLIVVTVTSPSPRGRRPPRVRRPPRLAGSEGSYPRSPAGWVAPDGRDRP